MKRYCIMIISALALISAAPAERVVAINAYSESSGPQEKVSKTPTTTSQQQQTTTKKKPASTTTKKTTTKPKQNVQGTEPAKPRLEPGTVKIGTQVWTSVNLNVSTFRNGDTIPEAKTNQEWVAAGEAKKPAWCYYNNDPANGPRYGKLYNWFAFSDPRGLAPAGWVLPGDSDWAQLTGSLGGSELAGIKLKSTEGWQEGANGTNESGFTAFAAGYRIENGTFQNLGRNAIWWSNAEKNTISAFDYYLSLRNSITRSDNPKQRGLSVRCLKKQP